MARARDRLEAANGRIKLVVRDRLIEEVAPKELIRLYDVTLPLDDPYLARFYLAEFQRSLWVIPFLTPGGWAAIEAFLVGRDATSELYRANLDRLPFRWRDRILGIPAFPIPRLLRCDRAELPSWTKLEGPLASLGGWHQP